MNRRAVMKPRELVPAEVLATLAALRAERDALREENERLKAGGWQPIETAPHDGTFVLVCIAGGWRPSIAHYGTYDGRSQWGPDPEVFAEEDHFQIYWFKTSYEPTHWMPLPKGPQS